jgi:hypothetical protein
MAIAQNGTGTAGAITGGTASSAAAAPPPAATASVAAVAPPPAASSASSNSGSMVSGTGTTTTGGACSCACLCGVAAFPNVAVQGVGAFGGMSGKSFSSLLPQPDSNIITGAMPLAALPA